VAIPDFQTIMRPLLVVLADGQEHNVGAMRDELAKHFSLTPDDLAAQIPSGRAKMFANRVGWATTHLYQTDRPS
jgi:restriction system protein